MAEALLYKDASSIGDVALEDLSSGQVIQLPDGRAGVVLGLAGAEEGDPVEFATEGQFTLAKTASVVILAGGRVYWDRSADTATPLQIGAGADFYIGTAPLGAASAASIAARISSEVGSALEPNAAIKRPSRPISSLWKFHPGTALSPSCCSAHA